MEEGDESPRRHSGKPKKQLAPDDAMDVDPEDEGMVRSGRVCLVRPR